MSQTLTDRLNAIQSIKANIKQAIESKGVTVDGTFDTYPRCIDSIETGGSDELAIALIDGTISGDVIIPDGTTSIRPYAFMGCSEITSVDFPASVFTLNDRMFSGCSSLKSVTIRYSEYRIRYEGSPFADWGAQNVILYVPEALLSDYKGTVTFNSAFAQIRAIGDEPAPFTGTITAVSTNPSDQSANECTLVVGQPETVSFTFFGSGLTDKLEYALDITVTPPEGYSIQFNAVNSVAQDGTWVTLDYVITSQYQSSYADEIQFSCGEWTGTINACSCKLRDAKFVQVPSYNDYPQSMGFAVNYYIDSSNSDVYINDAALQRISNCKDIDNVQSIICTEKQAQQYEDQEFVNYVYCRYEIQAANENDVPIWLKSLDGNQVYDAYTIPTAVHISQFTLNDAYAINGDEKIHLTKNENNAVVIPQVGPTILLPLSGLNDGVNVWTDSVEYSMTYNDDGLDMQFVMGINAVEEYEIDGSQYRCVRIDTNEISREQLWTAKDDNGGTIPPLKINVEIHGVSQSLDAVLAADTMTMPSGCEQLNSVDSAFMYNDVDAGSEYINHRYVDTRVQPTKNTIVKADIGLGDTHGNCIFGDFPNVRDDAGADLTDWRVMSQSSKTLGDGQNMYSVVMYFDYGHNSDGDDTENGNSVSTSFEVASQDNLRVEVENGKLTVKAFNDTVLAQASGTAWDGTDADNMQTISIFQNKYFQQTDDCDEVTLHEMKIYDSQYGVDLSAPLRHFVPVKVNDETKLFDKVTRRYYDFRISEIIYG